MKLRKIFCKFGFHRHAPILRIGRVELHECSCCGDRYSLILSGKEMKSFGDTT